MDASDNIRAFVSRKTIKEDPHAEQFLFKLLNVTVRIRRTDARDHWGMLYDFPNSNGNILGEIIAVSVRSVCRGIVHSVHSHSSYTGNDN